jgi:lipopolysaccharide export LptBFGC system permease protein LptF
MRDFRNLAADAIGDALTGLWRRIKIPVLVMAASLLGVCLSPGGCSAVIHDVLVVAGINTSWTVFLIGGLTLTFVMARLSRRA